MRRKVATLVLGALVIACASGTGEAEVVSSITNASLLPALEVSSRGAADLKAAAGEYCANPSTANRDALAEAWEVSKAAWGHAWLTTWFGPADMLRTVSRVDYQPIDEEAIEDLLASTEPLDADYMMNQAASTQRGLGAIEYLVYGESDPGEERRCELLSATVEVVASEVEALEKAWSESHQGGAPFAESFAGESMPSNDALGELVSAAVETLKQQSLYQVGKAIGISASEADPAAIPEGEAGLASDFYRAQLESIQSMLDAGAPDSLGDLVEARSPEVKARIDEHVEGAFAELDGIKGPMREIAADAPDDLAPLYEHLSDLLSAFESDVVSLLDITLGFSDTDGDTG